MQIAEHTMLVFCLGNREFGFLDRDGGEAELSGSLEKRVICVLFNIGNQGGVNLSKL